MAFKYTTGLETVIAGYEGIKGLLNTQELQAAVQFCSHFFSNMIWSNFSLWNFNLFRNKTRPIKKAALTRVFFHITTFDARSVICLFQPGIFFFVSYITIGVNNWQLWMMPGDYVEIWAVLLDWFCVRFSSRTSDVSVTIISPIFCVHIYPSTIEAM